MYVYVQYVQYIYICTPPRRKGKNGLEKVIELDQLPYFTIDSVCRLGGGGLIPTVVTIKDH